MRLHIIGNGCPTPTPQWYGSALVLEVGDDRLLFDCGPAATYKMARLGLDLKTIGRVFFTHHHYDHNVDFACFALTRWDHCRGDEPPLLVYGPPPTKSFVERLLGRQGAFAEDWVARIEHPASHAVHEHRKGIMPRPAPTVEASNVDPGPIAEGKGWRITAAAVHHVEPWLQSLAYRCDSAEGTVVFAGDCADCPELRRMADGADTLVIACAHPGRQAVRPAVVDVITGATEAGEIARDCAVKRVVLTHVNPSLRRPALRDQTLAAVARLFPGEVLLPDEMTTIELTPPSGDRP